MKNGCIIPRIVLVRFLRVQAPSSAFLRLTVVNAGNMWQSRERHPSAGTTAAFGRPTLAGQSVRVGGRTMTVEASPRRQDPHGAVPFSARICAARLCTRCLGSQGWGGVVKFPIDPALAAYAVLDAIQLEDQSKKSMQSPY